MEERSIEIETPIGSIKSDSGNHFIDIISVVFVISFFFILKKHLK